MVAYAIHIKIDIDPRNNSRTKYYYISELWNYCINGHGFTFWNGIRESVLLIFNHSKILDSMLYTL